MKNLEYQVTSIIESLFDDGKLYLKQLVQLKQLQSNKVQKPIWAESSKEDFNSLIKDIANSLDDGIYETTVNNHSRMQKNFLLEVSTRKISKNEVGKLYADLIKGDIAALKGGKGKSKDKRENMLNALKNLALIFTGTYLHYDSASKTESEPNFEESIAERTKLRRQELAEQEGQGLKILTPNQMLSRLSIFLSQKQEIILKNSKMKSDNYCILCTDEKNLQKQYIKV